MKIDMKKMVMLCQVNGRIRVMWQVMCLNPVKINGQKPLKLTDLLDLTHFVIDVCYI